MASPNTLKIRSIKLKGYKQGTIIHSGGTRYGSFPKKTSSKIHSVTSVSVANNKETDSDR